MTKRFHDSVQKDEAIFNIINKIISSKQFVHGIKLNDKLLYGSHVTEDSMWYNIGSENGIPYTTDIIDMYEPNFELIFKSDESAINTENNIEVNTKREEIINDVKPIEQRIKEYVNLDDNATYYEGSKNIWDTKCDIALACATQNEIDLESAKKLVSNGVICIGEGANMPSTNEAIKHFIENKVCFAPAKAANCGGVMVSGFEMSQNASHFAWTRAEVDQKLKQTIEGIFDSIHKIATEYNNPYDTVMGANILGFERVAKAMISLGVI